MGYILDLEIVIDPHCQENQKILQGLKNCEAHLMQTFDTLPFYKKESGPDYYHPDEYSEMGDIDNVRWRLRLHGCCGNLREVPFLLQLVQALTGLYDDPSGLACYHRLLEIREISEHR